MREKKYSAIFVLVFLLTCIVVPIVHTIYSALNTPDEPAETPAIYYPTEESLRIPSVVPRPDFGIKLPEKPVPIPFLPEANKNGPHKANPPEFGKAPKGYFEDALFIGDSRTVGIWEYGDFNKSDFFCSTGMTTIDIFKDSVDVEGVGNVTLKELLGQKKYGKIYVMLGINELGYPKESIKAAYKSLIHYIRKAQPDAMIYIQGNLHITKERSDSDEYFNNARINTINRFTERLADNIHVFYIEANSKFDDANGALAEKYSADNAHLLAKYYRDWCGWIRDNTVIEDTIDN
ncbi:MAG: GDSL-type esterase/lipase family protein [Clostridia bacterium]|nr:GDSL-type esterase/lipase family protein [Clostridia bacterium]MDO5302710.1 GDSL-type esterase/lipase family protein [Clostridia bacterium]